MSHLRCRTQNLTCKHRKANGKDAELCPSIDLRQKPQIAACSYASASTLDGLIDITTVPIKPLVNVLGTFKKSYVINTLAIHGYQGRLFTAMIRTTTTGSFAGLATVSNVLRSEWKLWPSLCSLHFRSRQTNVSDRLLTA